MFRSSTVSSETSTTVGVKLLFSSSIYCLTVVNVLPFSAVSLYLFILMIKLSDTTIGFCPFLCISSIIDGASIISCAVTKVVLESISLSFFDAYIATSFHDNSSCLSPEVKYCKSSTNSSITSSESQLSNISFILLVYALLPTLVRSRFKAFFI